MRAAACIFVYVMFGWPAMDGNDMSDYLDTMNYLNTIMECRKIPGLTMAGVKGDEDYAQGFGFADLDKDTPVNVGTQFPIGSITKMFNVVLLGILLEKNGFTWSNTVAEVLREPIVFSDDLRTNEMTIGDMLSHRTGVATVALGIFAQLRNTDPVDIVKRFKKTPAVREFREKFYYNNDIYVASAYLAERLGGNSWEILLRAHLLNPLGMWYTSVVHSDFDIKDPMMAKPYVYRNGTFELGTLKLYNIHPYEGARAMHSTASDMIKWMRFLLNHGKLPNGRQLLSSEFFDEMFKPAIPVTFSPLTQPTYPISEVKRGYGYGFFVSNHRGYRRVDHGGEIFSYFSQLMLYPDLNAGLFFSINGPGVDPLNTERAIYHYLADKLLDEEPWLNQSTGCTFPRPWADTKRGSTYGEYYDEQDRETLPFVLGNGQVICDKLGVDCMGIYVGNYSSAFLPDIEITEQDSSLTLQMNLLTGRLCPGSSSDNFLYYVDAPYEAATAFSNGAGNQFGIPVSFRRNKDDVITSAVFSLEIQVLITKTMDNSGASYSSESTWIMLTGVLVHCVCLYYLH